MNAADRLIGKAHDYEVLAASHSEREALLGGGEHLAAATAFTVAAIIMREVAAALEDEWECSTAASDGTVGPAVRFHISTNGPSGLRTRAIYASARSASNP